MLREDEWSLEQESSAIVDYRLGVIEATIQKARSIPAGKRDELLTMVAGLRSELITLAKTHHEEAASITRFADAATHETSRSKKNPQLSETALHGLSASIQGIEESHPVLFSTVSRFATALSSMGL